MPIGNSPKNNCYTLEAQMQLFIFMTQPLLNKEERSQDGIHSIKVTSNNKVMALQLAIFFPSAHIKLWSVPVLEEASAFGIATTISLRKN